MINNKLATPAKAALVLTIATFLCKGINILTTPLFTRILSTTEMGIVTTYNSWYSLLYPIACLSLDSGSFNIAMMDYRGKRYKYISSILILSTISSFLVGLVYFACKSLFDSIIGLNTQLMILMIVSFIFNPATTYWTLHQRYEYKYKSTAIITILTTGASTIIAALVTLYFSRKGVDNLADIRLFSGNVIIILCGLVFYVYLLFKGRTLYSKEFWGFVARVNSPLLVHSLSKHILDVSDRTMISYMVGKSAVGIYGVLYSVSAMALLVWNAINASLVPYMFESFNRNENEKVAVLVEKMLGFYSVACIGITLIAPEILKILAPSEYYEGVYMMPPIAAGIFFTSLYNIYSNILLFVKKTKSIAFSTLVAAVINIILNYYFIKHFGYQAACYTTLVSFIILALVQFLALKRTNDVNIYLKDKRIWFIASATCILCVSCTFLYQSNLIRYCVIGVLALFCVVFRKKLMHILRLISNKEAGC